MSLPVSAFCEDVFALLSRQRVSNPRNATIPKQANKTRAESQDAYMQMEGQDRQPEDFLQVLVDAREYDVPYYVRCSIDLDIRSVPFKLFVTKKNAYKC